MSLSGSKCCCMRLPALSAVRKRSTTKMRKINGFALCGWVVLSSWVIFCTGSAAAQIPTPTLNFDGMRAGILNGVANPDVNGAVGGTQYVQFENATGSATGSTGTGNFGTRPLAVSCGVPTPRTGYGREVLPRVQVQKAAKLLCSMITWRLSGSWRGIFILPIRPPIFAWLFLKSQILPRT